MLAFPLLAALLAGPLTDHLTEGSPADPPPTITRPSPDLVRRGTTSLITIRSKDAKRRFGPTCRVVFANPDGIEAKIRKNEGTQLTIAITLPAAAALGTRDLRIASDFGVSNTMPVFVTDLPVHTEKPAINIEAQTRPLLLGTVITGVIRSATERDRWRFTAKKGQDIELRVTTKDMSSRLDPTMTILAPDGKQIAWSSPITSGKIRLAFHCPADATYQLVLHDVQFRGGGDYRYHLRAGKPAADAEPGFPAENSTAESEPNEQIKDLKPFQPPFAVSARIATPADVDLFCFEVKAARTLVITADGGLFDSPIDPLLELRDAQGRRLKIDDDSGPGNAARIQYNFKPGRYIAAIRNLSGTGGERHRYLLDVSKPIKSRPEFEVRFRPDTVQVGRGSHTKLWCEVVRRGGFKGPVKLQFLQPPAGISISPIELGPGNSWTSVFTVHAKADAGLGTNRLRLSATAVLGDKHVEHDGIAEAGSMTSSSAWVTVLPRPAFLVAPLGPTSPETQQRWQSRRAQLVKRLASSNPKIAKELASFREAHQGGRHWVALVPTKMISRRRAPFSALEDGSVLVGGKAPGNDTYDIEFRCPLGTITALRLDALPHPSLPNGGPGRNGSGNFVLNRLLLAAAPLSAPDKMVKIGLHKVEARFQQEGFDARFALDDNIKTGWAMNPHEGKANYLITDLKTPIKNAGGSILRLTLDHLHGTQHLLGRFQISVAAERLPAKSQVVPPSVHAALGAGKNQEVVSKWFQSVSPSLARLRAQIAAIDAGQGNQRAIKRIERRLRSETPELIAARREWETAMIAKLVRWTELPITSMRSEKGVKFEKQADHVVRVERAVADADDFQLLAKTGLQNITAIRLEALSDATLPGKGPGLAANGNFVLSGFELAAAPAGNPGAFTKVPLAAPQASFEQRKHRIAQTLDGNAKTGWGVLGNLGKPSFGLWRTRKPLTRKGGIVLRFDLRHRTANARHQLGRFRLSVTDAKAPALSEQGLPVELARALTTKASRRSPEQLRMIAVWFRRTAPHLEPLRARADLLRAEQVAYPPRLQRGKSGSLAVRIARTEGYQGPLTLSLEGFSSGRERNRSPRSITRNLAIDPVTLEAGQSVAVLKLRATSQCELGTRAVVVRAVGKRDGKQFVEYSAPIQVTVTK